LTIKIFTAEGLDMPEIAVVGSVNMDLIVRTPHLPVPGETVLGRTWSTAPGGKGANQAVAAAKLGAQVVMVGRVGPDDFGRTLRQEMAAAGVDMTYVTTDEQEATGVALIAVEDGGQNTIIVSPGANARVSRADVDAAKGAITASKVLVVQLELPLDTETYALDLGRASHIVTLLNPAPAQPLPSPVLARVDWIVPNETEASHLTGIAVTDWASAEAAARELGRRGPQIVVITLGARGALAWDGNAIFRVPAFPVQPVDATAAGDAFVGALARAIARGADLLVALNEASAAGALATLKLGAQPSLPTFAELEQFLSQHAKEIE
jgi:ribokinase